MRGQYAPIDRSRKPVQAWAADEFVEYAAGPAIRAGYRAVRSTRGVYHGARGLAQSRGTSAQVGSEWFHTVSDRQSAVNRLNADFAVLAADLAAAVTANPTPAGAQFLSADVTPLLKDWVAFAKRETDSWLTRAATDWRAFESWLDRLRRLRSLARSHGIALTSPEPIDLPTTVWDRAASGESGGATSWLGVARVGVLGVIGLAGVHGLYTLWRDVKGG